MNESTLLRTFTYGGVRDAQRAAHRLSAARADLTVDDAAIVSWPADRSRPIAWQARDLTADHRLSGAFWGLLFAQLFLLPLSMKLAPPLAVDRLDGTLCCLGVEPAFVRTVRDQVVPGRSALFVLGGDPRTPLESGNASASLRLSAEQVARLRAGFDDE